MELLAINVLIPPVDVLIKVCPPNYSMIMVQCHAKPTLVIASNKHMNKAHRLLNAFSHQQVNLLPSAMELQYTNKDLVL